MQGGANEQTYAAQDMGLVPHSTLAELTHHGSTVWPVQSSIVAKDL